MKVLVAGAGWAGLACAISLTQAHHEVTLIEASRFLGGRARAVGITLPSGQEAVLDNGQHILIGAYSDTLQLMRQVGIDPLSVLHRIPLTLRFPSGDALQLPDWTKPLIPGLDVAWGICRARGWSWADKFSLLRAAALWRLKGFRCDAQTSVAQLCTGITAPVMQMLIEPLCVSALNTPATRASGQVFLRILQDSLFASVDEDLGSSNLLLPKTDLGALFPQAAAAWLAQHGCQVHLGERLMQVSFPPSSPAQPTCSAQISGRGSADVVESFEAVVLATPPSEAARIARASGCGAWADSAGALQHEAIATVYAHAAGARLPCAMMALQSSVTEPAQFVFDRGALTGQDGLLAFVVSASDGDAATLQKQVILQGRKHLGLAHLQAVQTIIDKRATFACTPNLKRPSAAIAPQLIACGDYIEGPYPSTLEGAVRSGLNAAKRLTQTPLP